MGGIRATREGRNKGEKGGGGIRAKREGRNKGEEGGEE